jgi:hypothetical protein
MNNRHRNKDKAMFTRLDTELIDIVKLLRIPSVKRQLDEAFSVFKTKEEPR